MGWLSGWNYRKSHVINPSTGAGTGYQVKIVVHYGSGTDSGADVYVNGKCRTDFGDIRFTGADGTTLYPYWMQYKVDGDYAIFWVKILDDLSTSQATIYVYYGNSSASSISNGSQTFLLFESFETISSNPSENGWSLIINQSPVDGVSTTVYYEGLKSYYITTSSTTRDRAWSKTCPISNNVEVQGFFRTSGTISTYNSYTYMGHVIGFGTSSYILAYRTAVSTGNSLRAVTPTADYSMSITYANNVWNSIGVRVYGGSVRYTYNFDTKYTVTTSDTMSTVVFGSHGVNYATTGYYDAIFVKKYVDPEPSHGTWGVEESYSSYLAYYDVYNSGLYYDDSSLTLSGYQNVYDTFNNGLCYDDSGISLPVVPVEEYYDVYNNGLNLDDASITLSTVGEYFDILNNGINFDDANITSYVIGEYFDVLNNGVSFDDKTISKTTVQAPAVILPFESIKPLLLNVILLSMVMEMFKVLKDRIRSL